MNKKTIYTAYHSDTPNIFCETWIKNTLRYSDGIVCLTTKDNSPYDEYASYINVNYNLGHIGVLLEKKQDQLSGWTAHVAVLAMVAYSSGKDLIYKEQDCLWHGPVIETMYNEMGDRKFIFGKKMESKPWMLASQSTFIVKWDFIPQFTSRLLSLPPCRTMLSEDKFVKIEESYPDQCCRTSLDCERERPIPWDAQTWYAQKLTPEELEIWKNIG